MFKHLCVIMENFNKPKATSLRLFGVWATLVLLCFMCLTPAAANTPVLFSGGPLNVALGRPVMVSEGGTCGSEGEKQALIPTVGSSGVEWGNRGCTTTCERLYPQDGDNITLLAANDVVTFGDVDCKGDDTKVEVEEDWTCYVNISRDTDTDDTYLMWVKLDANQSDDQTLVEAANFKIDVSKTTTSLVIGEDSVPYKPAEWFQLVILVNKGSNTAISSVFMNGKKVGSASSSYVPGIQGQRLLVGTCAACKWKTPSGQVKNIQMFNYGKTFREIEAMYSGNLPEVSPASDCLCPASNPQIDSSNQRLGCNDLASPASIAPRLANAESDAKFYLPDFMVDGIEGAFYQDNKNYPMFWASQPNTKDITLTVDLLDLVEVSMVTIQSMSGLPEGSLLIKRYIDKIWMPWQYLSADCSNLPSSTTPCTTIIGSVQTDTPAPITWNVSNSFSDRDSRLAEDVSIVFLGTPSQSNKVHIITELQIEARYVPYFTAMDPVYGPAAGGTDIRFTGGNLDYYDFTINLSSATIDVDCLLKEKKMDYVIFTTPSITLLSDNLPHKVKVAPASSSGDPLDQTFEFEYRVNPFLGSIKPMKSILSGGIVQEVIGRNFDSVAYPYFQIRTTDNAKELSLTKQMCRKVDQEKLLCPTPSTTAPEMATKTGALNSASLKFYGGVIFDGFTNYENYGEIQVYVDPIINDFTSVISVFMQWQTSELTIKGKNLDVVSQSNYDIKIGNEICPIVELTNEELKCKAPEKQPTAEFWELNFHGAPPTLVKIGNLEYQPGFLIYHYSIWSDNTYRVGILVAVFAVFMILLVIALTYLSRAASKKQPTQENVPMETSKDLFMLLDKDTQATLKPYKIDHRRVTMGSEIQKGNFGGVYNGKVKSADGAEAPIVIKAVNESGLLQRAPLEDLSSYIDQTRGFLQECTVFLSDSHNRIYKPLGVSFRSMQVSVVYPYTKNGNLRSFLRDTSKVLTVVDLTRMGIDVSEGMTFLESRNIVHGDLAARNCIVDNRGNVLVSDAGLAQDLAPDEYLVIQGSTKSLAIRWAAPELFQGQQPNPQTDVWSYGVVLWELFTRGQIPYAHVQTKDVIIDILQGEMLSKPHGCPEAHYELMKNCWDPSTRPPFATITEYLERVKLDVTSSSANGSVNVAYVPDENPPGYFTAVRLDKPERPKGYNPGRVSLLDEVTTF